MPPPKDVSLAELDLVVREAERLCFEQNVYTPETSNQIRRKTLKNALVINLEMSPPTAHRAIAHGIRERKFRPLNQYLKVNTLPLPMEKETAPLS